MPDLRRLPFRNASGAAAVLAFLLVLPNGWARNEPAHAPFVIRVDPQGHDDAKGLAEPVATLGRALDLAADLRRQAPTRPIAIDLAPGVFRVDRAIRIGTEVSGTKDAPLLIRGAPGGATRLTGGVALHPLSERLDARILARLPAEARTHVRLYRLPAAALAAPRIQAPRRLSDPPKPVALEVYDETGPLTPARWPKQGWAHVGKGSAASDEPSFTLDDARLARWRDEPDLWAEGFWNWNWLYESLPVTGVDVAHGRVQLGAATYDGIKPGAKFRVTHALSELDAPGEWWRDEADGLLVAWPRPGQDVLDVAITDTLLSFENASHVHIEGLRLDHARGDLMVASGGTDITLRDSAIRDTAGRGAVFEAMTASGLDHCTIEGTGRTAVRIVGGDRPSLTSGRLFVRDSHIAGYARLSLTQNAGVEVEGVGASIAGNFIHDASGPGIVLRGNDHHVEHNELSNLLGQTGDNGAIYSGRDWSAQGNVIEHNFIHDIRAGRDLEVKGVYLDDSASGFVVRDNLFVRVDQPVFIGGGRDNRVEHNIFVDSSPAIHVDSRGQTWAVKAATDPASELRQAYAAMPVATPLWRERYPHLAEILEDTPQVAKRNLLRDNVFVASTPLNFDDGGNAANQIVAGNIGPDGVTLGSGQDPATSVSDDPDDFVALKGPDGAALPRLDVSGMRRSTALRPLFGSARR